MKFVENIIIGGGIAGLSSARTLCNNQKDFLLISKNIGGRIITSSDGNVNYGAYLISSYYQHIKPFVKITRPVYPTNLELHLNKKKYTFFSFKLLKYFPEVIKFMKIIRKFKKEYFKLKIKEPYYSQKKLISENKYLNKLYTQNAEIFIKENKIENLVKEIISEPIYAITFSSIKEGNAFPFLQGCLLLMSNMHEFNFLPEKLIKGFEDKIIENEVIEIKKNKEKYIVHLKNEKIVCKNLILATPIKVTQKLINIPIVNNTINVHMYHVNGNIRNKYSKKEFELFSPNSNLVVIAHQHDGTYLIYSKSEINFENIFTDYHIIKHIYWNPAFMVPGPYLQEQKIENNLFVAGDFNLCGMEDAFLSGQYVANCLLNKNLD